MKRINKLFIWKENIKSIEFQHKLILVPPLISILLIGISLIIPVIWQPERLYWIFGLIYTKGQGFAFLSNYMLFWSVASSLILILAVYALIQNIRFIVSMKGRSENGIIKFWLAWILVGMTFIFVAILYFRIYPNLIFNITYPNTFKFSFLMYISGSMMIVTGISLRVLNYYRYCFI